MRERRGGEEGQLPLARHHRTEMGRIVYFHLWLYQWSYEISWDGDRGVSELLGSMFVFAVNLPCSLGQSSVYQCKK